MMKRLAFILFCIVLMAISLFAPAETSAANTNDTDDIVDADDPYADALITDRPDIADTSYTVGKLRFQIETSFEFTQDVENNITTRRYSFPTLFRFGIIDPLELRVESEWFIIQTQSGQPAQKGFSDVSFGLKGHVLDAAPGGIPSMALMAMVNAPTGKDSLSSNAWEPTFLVLADWEALLHFTLGVNLGVDVPVRDLAGDKYARFLYAVAFGYIVHGTQKRLKTFIEVAGAAPLKSNKDNLVSLNTGVMFLLTPNMQIDGYVRVGLTTATPDMQGGVGYAVRF